MCSVFPLHPAVLFVRPVWCLWRRPLVPLFTQGCLKSGAPCCQQPGNTIMPLCRVGLQITAPEIRTETNLERETEDSDCLTLPVKPPVRSIQLCGPHTEETRGVHSIATRLGISRVFSGAACGWRPGWAKALLVRNNRWCKRP